MEKMSLHNIILLMILVAFISCQQEKPEAEGAMSTITPVTITNINICALADSIELNAVSAYMKKSIIKSSITGIIESVEIVVGENVNSDQLLFTVKTKEASALAENTKNRDSSFLFKGLIKIKSSRSGVITTLSHQKGDFIQEGEELATISEQNSLVFLLEVPYELNAFVKSKSSCKILLPDNSHLLGTIGAIMPSMDVQSQIAKYQIAIHASKNIPENLIAKVLIAKNYKLNAATLPRQAVLANETQSEFWVMKLINDSIAVKIPITKGLETKDKVEIVTPEFTKDSRIILAGGYGLADTAKVLITK